MARKRYSDEDCLKLLREIELQLAAGSDIATSCRSAGISDATYYTWRKRFGGMVRFHPPGPDCDQSVAATVQSYPPASRAWYATSRSRNLTREIANQWPSPRGLDRNPAPSQNVRPLV